MLGEKEQRIIEQRTIEATRKLYMGSSGKISSIARHLGQPIICHSSGGGLYDVNYLEDPFYQDMPDTWDQRPAAIQQRIPYMDEYREIPTQEPISHEWRESRNYSVPIITPNTIGWLFDGLSRGMHLEVKTDRKAREIQVSWKGYLVYKEDGGNLLAYVPNKDWEDKIESLFHQVELRTRERRKEEREEEKEELKKEKKDWLQSMKEIWGM